MFFGPTQVRDSRTGQLLYSVKGDGGFPAVFSKDGKRFISSSADGMVRVYETATGGEVLSLKTLGGAAFSPDGRRILTAAPNRTAKVWDAATGRELMELQLPAKVAVLAFSPDGRQILTGCSDGTVILWPAADWTANVSAGKVNG